MKVFTKLAAMAAIAIGIAACGRNAHAAEPVIVQDTSNGGLYVVDDHSRLVAPYTADQIRVTRDTGSQDYIGAGIYNTLRTRLLARGWVDLYNGQGLVSTAQIARVYCANGILTIAWAAGVTNSTFSDPSCGTYQLLNNRAQSQQ